MSVVSAPVALWYAPVADVGGVARHLCDAARAGIPGFRMVFAVPAGPLADELRTIGAAVVTGPFSPQDGPRRSVPALRRLLRALRPSVLHSHLAYADLVAAAAVTGRKAADSARIRLITTEHGIAADAQLYQSNALTAKLKQQLHALRLRRTDRLIAVSDSTREQVLAQWGSGAPVTVIRNGIDRPADPAPARSGLRVLSLARLAPEKRISALLDAFALVAAEHPGAQLTLAGEGPLREDLDAQVKHLNLAERVTLPGVMDGPAAIAEHDVVVQLSAWENLSYTLLDAAAAGLGVVATDVGGNREITQGVGLVNAADPAAVAAMIVRQGLEPDQRPLLPDSVPSVSGMTEQIAEVYWEAMNR